MQYIIAGDFFLLSMCHANTVLTEIGFRILQFACSYRTVLRRGAYCASPSVVQGLYSNVCTVLRTGIA
jgi:hypothetical protein